MLLLWVPWTQIELQGQAQGQSNIHWEKILDGGLKNQGLAGNTEAGEEMSVLVINIELCDV